jgi:fagellar hook-basal body proteins
MSTQSMWISKTGLEAQQTRMSVISNNLANVNTTGYKKSRAVFEDLLYQNVRQVGAQSSQDTILPTGLQIGTGVRTVATEKTHTQGTIQQTGNSLDIAVNGQGFFKSYGLMAPSPIPVMAVLNWMAMVKWSPLAGIH